jgi:hypothetical protein
MIDMKKLLKAIKEKIDERKRKKYIEIARRAMEEAIREEDTNETTLRSK